jgi:DNA-binding transcriptional LysR family regulator
MDIGRLDLNLLRVMDAMLQTRKVTEAAVRLSLSQPALSFALGKLRKFFDDPLFVRTARGMQPTPLALQMAGPVHEILELVRAEVLQRSTFDPGTTERKFTLSLSDAGEMVFLPRLLRSLRQSAPGANVSSVQLPPTELEQAMEAGEVDLAVGYFPDLTKEGFYQQRLFAQPFVCIMRADHPTIGNKLSLKQFLSASHAVVRPEGRSQEIFERTLDAHGVKRRIALSIPHFMSVPFIIMESDLIVTVPLAVGRSFAKMTNLKMFPLPISMRDVDLKQHWHARFHRDPVNRWLRGLIHTVFGEDDRSKGEMRKASG